VTVGYLELCVERHELRVRVGYMKLCVDKDGRVGDSWLHEAVCRGRLSSG